MNSIWFKKGVVISLVTSFILGMSGAQLESIFASDTEETYNYAEAFQKSLYFYDANQCGDGITGGALDWRADCHLEDKKIPLQPIDQNGYGTNLSEQFIEENKTILDRDGDGYVDLSGGYHDAGDHVKFGLPQSYSGATLGWGYYEFRTSYITIGEQKHIESILRRFNDYFLKSTFLDGEGKVVAFAYQVGEGSSDHNYWGSPELQTTPRPAYFATSESPASDQCAGVAASLAINYLNFKDNDPEYAKKCLDVAKALYEFAKENRGLGYSGGFYNSSYDEDQMSWAAVWLNIATGDELYIKDITSVDENGKYTGYMKRIISTTSSTWQNIWVHSWDTVWGGVFAKLAPITNEDEHWYFFRWNLEYWSDTPHEGEKDGSFLAGTPAGFKVLDTWGSARYNSAAQLCALVYNKYKTNPEFVAWAKSQMDYLLGDNPMNRSYEVGFGENAAKKPHHRAAHGSLTNSMLDPEEERHVLWGALVGGPDQSDFHKDEITDYVYNEVAIDYNAGFVGALAGLYEIYGEGQQPLNNFPEKVPDEKPYYSSALIEQESSERSQISVIVHNDTSTPPRRVDTMKVRYFFNISEMLEKGQSIDDVSVQVMYDQALILDNKSTKINGPYVWDEKNGIYYIELDWTGNDFHGSRQIQFALVPALNSEYTTTWNPENDWSHIGLMEKGVEVETVYVPVYINEQLVLGKEPPKEAKVNLKVINSEEEFDYTKEVVPVELEADLTEAQASKVEFYANDTKIGEVSKAPYAITFEPTQEEMTSNITKEYTFYAKAIMEAGEVTSNKVAVNIRFKEATECPVSFADGIANRVLDVANGEKQLEIKVDKLETFTASIKLIEIYANDEMIGSSESDHCTAIYYASEGYGPKPDGIIEVVLLAKVTLDTGEIVQTSPIIIKVKMPVRESYANLMELQVVGTGEILTNTITRKYILKNISTEELDLSSVKIRYYFTKDSNSSQKFFSDSAGIKFNTEPWYQSITNCVNGKFISLAVPVDGADTYLEITFKEVDYNLQVGQSVECETRIANSNWSFFTQENDYSYNNKDHIILLYENEVVCGVEPQ